MTRPLLLALLIMLGTVLALPAAADWPVHVPPWRDQPVQAPLDPRLPA